MKLVPWFYKKKKPRLFKHAMCSCIPQSPSRKASAGVNDINMLIYWHISRGPDGLGLSAWKNGTTPLPLTWPLFFFVFAVVKASLNENCFSSHTSSIPVFFCICCWTGSHSLKFHINWILIKKKTFEQVDIPSFYKFCFWQIKPSYTIVRTDLFFTSENVLN